MDLNTRNNQFKNQNIQEPYQISPEISKDSASNKFNLKKALVYGLIGLTLGIILGFLFSEVLGFNKLLGIFIGALFLGLSLGFLGSRANPLTPLVDADTSSEPLTTREKVLITITSIFVSPVIAGIIIYTTWGSKYPRKTKEAMRIAFITLVLYAVIIVVLIFSIPYLFESLGKKFSFDIVNKIENRISGKKTIISNALEVGDETNVNSLRIKLKNVDWDWYKKVAGGPYKDRILVTFEITNLGEDKFVLMYYNQNYFFLVSNKNTGSLSNGMAYLEDTNLKNIEIKKNETKEIFVSFDKDSEINDNLYVVFNLTNDSKIIDNFYETYFNKLIKSTKNEVTFSTELTCWKIKSL